MPALAASAWIWELPRTLWICSGEIGRFFPVETHELTTSPSPFWLNLFTRPVSPPDIPPRHHAEELRRKALVRIAFAAGGAVHCLEDFIEKTHSVLLTGRRRSP